MHPIDVLPNPDIQPNGVISNLLLQQGLTSFQSACRYVKAMPYGSNSNSADSVILFEEGHGTCTTKHGAIARLAQEISIPVYKNLGFYRLNDAIVTGVNGLLQPYGLSFIPQIHCFLEYQTYRIDLTEGNCNGKNKTIEDYDFVIRVAPDLSEQQHQDYYMDYLKRYRVLEPQLARLSDETVLELLEMCDRQLKYQCSILTSKLLSSA